MRLLSVDFDYFFDTTPRPGESSHLYDWESSEFLKAFELAIWLNRAAGFIINKHPLPGLTGLETSFWRRFRFTKGCRVYVADSHSQIYDRRVRSRVRSVVSYDAHCDAGYGMTRDEFFDRGQVECDTWTFAYELQGIPTRVLLPEWRRDSQEHTGPMSLGNPERLIDDGRDDPEPFGRVFICRSGAWLPSWLDGKFDNFVRECPIPIRKHFTLGGRVERRPFSLQVVTEMAETMARHNKALVNVCGSVMERLELLVEGG